MKIRALAICFLLLLPLGIIAMPHKAEALVLPAIFVVPRHTNLTGPCIKSTTFTVDVWLYNNGFSGIDVYGVDFTLDWSSISANYLYLVNDSIVVHSPWANFFIAKNETSPLGAKNSQTSLGVPIDPITDYHLSILATPPSTGLIDVNQSLVTLTFHVQKDICWPDVVDGTFHIDKSLVKIVSDGSKVVPVTDFEVDDGFFHLESAQPNIELASTSATDPTTSSDAWVAEIIQKCASHQIDIEVDLTNVTGAFGFAFYMTFDPNYLELDIQKMTIKAAFPPPYEVVDFTSGDGWVQLIVVRPSEKPGVCGAVVPAADIIFHTIDLADLKPKLPTKFNSTISITDAIVVSKCPDVRFYTISATSMWYPGGLLGYGGSGYPDLLYGGDFKYVFKPSKYDLTLDCVVDIQDLLKLKPYYGAHQLLGQYGDLYDPTSPATEHLVDIYDFVAIAKHFGPVDP